MQNELGLITQGRGAANVYDRGTGKEIAAGFVTIRTSGVQELVDGLLAAARQLDPSGRIGETALKKAVGRASKIIADNYKANVGDVTGNLRKSVKTEFRVYDNAGSRAVVGVTGPKSSGTGSASEREGSGNHAWLVEFGTPPRRPGTQGRRTYINIHQSINRKMTRHSASNDEQFQRMSRGYYFLMGSINEPTRQARHGSGYPHDFMSNGDGKIRPMTLHPGETYGGMKPTHAMENAISSSAAGARAALEASIVAQIKGFTT